MFQNHIFKAVIVSLLLLAINCSKKTSNTQVSNSEEFAEFIQGHTSGEISSHDGIAVSLTKPIEIDEIQQLILFSSTPKVNGQAELVNDHTVVFKPNKPLTANQEYLFTLALDKLTDVPEGKETFTFGVKTIKQEMEVALGDLELVNRNAMKLSGTIYTADKSWKKDVSRTINITQNQNEELEISWLHNDAGTTHNFEITNIKRGNIPSKVEVRWDGTPIGAESKGSKTIEVAENSEFRLLATRVYTDDNPRIELIFSDKLSASQNIDGLIQVEDMPEINTITDANKLILSPRSIRNGAKNLLINAALKNDAGKQLGIDIVRQIQFNQPKPQLELLGKGAVIPSSEKLLFPFKAVSLGAVDVKITRIFENNIGQYFQEYGIDDNNTWQLNRVGRQVFGAAIPLSNLGKVEAGLWNNYALDLSEIIKPEPGALYQVEMGFRKHQAVYECGDNDNNTTNELTNRSWTYSKEEEAEYWRNGGEKNYYGYNWRERENPCEVSYYYAQENKRRNILASDLGIIAKGNGNGKTTIYVTDLKSTDFKNGVKVEVFDYQQQLLAAGITAQNGKVELTTERNPFYLVATSKNQKGYLKLEDGNSLSVSDFDVSGANVQKGIKGFLYGERGVWRPGDSLFVTLILEDKNEVLPKNHPVSFEFKNPARQLVDRKTFTSSTNGFYSYKTATDKQAPTGNWLVTAKVGGLTFSKNIKIETVKPNRLKVEVDFEEDVISDADRKLDAKLSSRWLHGAIARNLKADVEMSTRGSNLSFPKYKGFSFSDESVSYSSSPIQIFEGNLDRSGSVDFSHTFKKLDEGPGRIQVNLKSRVFEPSGSFSVGSATTYYYPFKTLVAVKTPEKDDNSYSNWLSRNTDHKFEVISVDKDGKAVPNTSVKVEVYNIRWRWWWESNLENLSSYFERENVRKIREKTVSTDAEGKGNFNLKITNIDEGGRYLVRVSDENGGHSASQIVYFSWYGGQSSGISPARLTFSSNKEEYNVDEQIELTIPSSAGSKILLSLETGSNIIDTRWIDGEKRSTKVTIKATPEMSPNVYANVMHIQPHAQANNDLPIRMYGVIPIKVNDPSTILEPVVKLPSELKPETEALITVSGSNNKAMTYTIAVVDEGLLDLTNFKTPNPHELFYAREALGIKTWDIFGSVSDMFTGSLSRILAIGGDGELQAVENPLNEANRFEPMVRFMGPFNLEKGKTNKHQITVPNYVGSVRTMVIAGNNGAYGETEQTTPVRKPVMVLATLPRVLGPGERVDLPVSVFAMNESIKQVNVEVESNDLFEIVNNKTTEQLSFSEPGDELVTFKLETKPKIGVGKIRVDANSGNENAYHEIEIAVRNPNQPFVDVTSKIIQANSSWETSFDPKGMEGTNEAILEISRIPPIDFGRRLGFLIRYPYGCVEQSVSAVFPQLFVADVMEIDSDRKSEMQSNINQAIKRLEKFVTVDGGLSYWPGHEDANAWGTTYGYHFLLEADKKGYYVPSTLLNQINRFQQLRARTWNSANTNNYYQSDLIQAYRLYTLALANSPDLGAMNRLREKTNLSTQAKWRLAAAYAIAGQPEAANDVIENTSTEIKDYRELSGSYGSTLRDQAMILETLNLLNRKEEGALIARTISEQLSSQRWLSTQTTAYALIAISKYVKNNSSSGEITASYSLNGQQVRKINSNAYITQVKLKMSEISENNLVFNNETGGVLYSRLILKGTPLLGDNITNSNSLSQKVRFTDLDGNTINPEEIEQGTDLIAEVTVTNPGLRGDYEELALNQIFPSGWEIRNTRMDDPSFAEPTASFEYQDIRDDRVYTFFDLRANQSKTFRVQLNASYSGRFYLPATTTQAMYDETISARTAGKWVNVDSDN